MSAIKPLTDDLIDSVIRDVAELDYSSPEGMPDVMLVTADELRAELLKSLADNAALRERVKLLEDALRHVDDCLSINDYDDYVLLSRFDSDIVSAALEQKP